MRKIISLVAPINLVVSAFLFGQIEPIPRLLNLSSSETFAGQFADGTEWTHESMTFELGTFSDGVPTYSSVVGGGGFSWVNADTYNNVTISWETIWFGWIDDYYGTGQPGYVGAFDGNFNLMSNDFPFGAGNQLYIWGYTSPDPADNPEWILFTNPSWTVPLLEPLPNPLAVLYSLTDHGTEIVEGFASMILGSGQHLISVAIPEPSTYALIFGIGLAGLLGIRRLRR